MICAEQAREDTKFLLLRRGGFGLVQSFFNIEISC
jgi:hypothetical protein